MHSCDDADSCQCSVLDLEQLKGPASSIQEVTTAKSTSTQRIVGAAVGFGLLLHKLHEAVDGYQWLVQTAPGVDLRSSR